MMLRVWAMDNASAMSCWLNTVGLNTVGEKTVGLNTVGENTVGLNTVGENTVGLYWSALNTVGLNTVGEKTVGLNTVGAYSAVSLRRLAVVAVAGVNWVKNAW